MNQDIQSYFQRTLMVLLTIIFTTAMTWAQEEVITTVANGIYTGFTVTAVSNGAEGNYVEDLNIDDRYYNLVDGRTDTKWCVVQEGGTYNQDTYIEFRSSMAFVPMGYILTTGNDNGKYPGRNPLGWTIKAKLKNNDEWTELVTVTNDNQLQDVNNASYEFSIPNNTSKYQYFRFEFNSVHNGGVFQLSEFQFKDCDCPVTQSRPVISGFTATSGSSGFYDIDQGTDERYYKLVDDDKTTKWCGLLDTPTYIEFYHNSAFVPVGYILTTGNDNESNPGRNPTGWTIKAKLNANDGWTNLVTVTDDNQLQDVNNTSYEFTIPNNTSAYRYFRFEFNAIHNTNYNYDNRVFQLSELQFISQNAPDNFDLSYGSIAGVSETYESSSIPLTLSDFKVYDANRIELERGIHYTVTLDGVDVSNTNIIVDGFGSHTLTVTGINRYYGTLTKTFYVESPYKTICFYTDEGGTVIDPITEIPGTAISAPDDPTRPGYTFDGWVPEIPATMPDEDMIIAAQWTLIDYSIDYELNGGSLVEGISNPESYTVENGAFTLNNPSKTGYTFTGWTGTDLNEPTVSVTIAHGSTGNRAYTANWTINQHTISFVTGNGGTAIDPITQNYGTTITAPANPTRPGCIFAGWDKEIPVTMPDEDMTITAQWTLIDYSIAYELNGDSLGEGISNPESYSVEDAFTLNNPSKTGYTFIGWTGSDLSEPTVSVTIAQGSTGNRAYTANWTINQHTVTFVTDNGGTAIDPITQDYGTTITAPADPTRPGYIFAGWDKDIPTTVPDEDMTITALWTLINYSIAYELNGGSLAEGINNPESYTVEDAFTLNNPSKTGYTFTGWTGTDLSEPTVSVTITQGSTGNRVYTANWTINQYTVTFVTGNGGTAIDPITQDYGTTITAPADPTRPGYIFAGWDKDIPATMPAEDLTITAKWQMAYRNADGQMVVCPDATRLTAPQYNNIAGVTHTLATGWYYVEGYCRIEGFLAVSGEVNLLLTDGATLDVIQGVIVVDNNTLNIYGQSSSGGTLNACTSYDNRDHACIGAGLTSGTCGNICIYGGTINTAKGYRGATIGQGHGGSGGDIKIYGGIVKSERTSGYIGLGRGQASHSDCNITLGWSAEDDRIYIDYYWGNLTMDPTKPFRLQGTNTAATTDNFLGKWLIPVTRTDYTLTLPKGMEAIVDGLSVTTTQAGKTVELRVKDGYRMTGVPTVTSRADGELIVTQSESGYTFTMLGSDMTVTAMVQKLITITAASDSKAYDGTPLTNSSYSFTALEEGDAIESVTMTGSQTQVGSSDNVPSAAVIKNGDTDVSENYLITYVSGTLTISYYNASFANNAANSTIISTIYDNYGGMADVRLTGRTLWKDGDWNTLCLPFDVVLDGSIFEDATVMALDGSNSNLTGSTLTLNFIQETEKLAAGTPYLIMWEGDGTNNIVDPAFNSVAITATTPTDVEFDGGSFKGCYDYTEYATENKSILFLGEKNTLFWPQPNFTDTDHPVFPSIGAFRAYFQLNEPQIGVRAFNLNFTGEGSTGISNASRLMNNERMNKEGMNNEFYDLQGRWLKKPTKKGLYINNGQKIIIH